MNNILNYYQIKQAEIDPALLATGLATLIGGLGAGTIGYFDTNYTPFLFDKELNEKLNPEKRRIKNALMNAIMGAAFFGSLTAGLNYGEKLYKHYNMSNLL